MENNLNGIRRLSLISLGYEDGFQAKPVHNYDVYISEKKYNKMLSDEKKIPLNWFKQVWQYALYLFQLAYKSISIAITAIFVILFLSFITTDPVKAINVDDEIKKIKEGNTKASSTEVLDGVLQQYQKELAELKGSSN